MAENDLTCSLVALDPASGARLQTVQIGGPAVGGPATAECTASDVTVSGASVVASVSYRLGTPQAGGCTLPPATAIASGPVAVDSAGGGA